MGKLTDAVSAAVVRPRAAAAVLRPVSLLGSHHTGLVTTSHTFSGAHTLDTHTTEPKSHKGPIRGALSRVAAAVLLCSSRLRRPRPAAAAHLHTTHTTTPISYAAAPP